MYKKKGEDGYNIQVRHQKSFDRLKAVTFINQEMIILSSDQVFQCTYFFYKK